MAGKGVNSQAGGGHHCQPCCHSLQHWHTPCLIPAAEQEGIVPTVQLRQNLLQTARHLAYTLHHPSRQYRSTDCSREDPVSLLHSLPAMQACLRQLLIICANCSVAQHSASCCQSTAQGIAPTAVSSLTCEGLTCRCILSPLASSAGTRAAVGCV